MILNEGFTVGAPSYPISALPGFFAVFVSRTQCTNPSIFILLCHRILYLNKVNSASFGEQLISSEFLIGYLILVRAACFDTQGSVVTATSAGKV